MSCRSEEKIICPYCGAEMKTKTAKHVKGGAVGWTMCRNENCMAEGPLVIGKTVKKAAEAARAAALRRYTPPQPMTLQKPMAKLEEALGKEIEIEIKGEDRFRKVSIPVYARMAKQFEIIVPRNIAHIDPVILPTEDYGKTWRCWERKPTDEERSAAEWETSKQE